MNIKKRYERYLLETLTEYITNVTDDNKSEVISELYNRLKILLD